jgi:hypothetical protein
LATTAETPDIRLPPDVEPGVSRGTPRALVDYRLDDLKLDPENPAVRNVHIGGVLTDGSLSLTINGASTVEITLQDSDKDLLRGDFLTRWTWGTNADHTDEAAWIRDGRKIDLELDDLAFRLARLAKGAAGSLVLTFEELSVAKLREKRGTRSAIRQTVGRTGVTRAQFVKMLADEAKVPTHIPELRDPQRILPAQGLTPVKPAKPPKKAGAKSTRTQAQRSALALRGIPRRAGLTVKGQRATSENYRVAQIGLDEAAALHAPRNAAIALIAAYIAENDMTNHPGGGGGSSGSLQLIPSTAHSLGVSPLNIKGCAELFLKRGFAGKGGAIKLGRRGMAPADIATAVQGNRDGASTYAPFVREAHRWVSAYSPTGAPGGALGFGIGLPSIGPSSVTIEKPYSFSRGANETSWDAIQRLAAEVQWRAFVRKGVLWYISDDALRAQAAALTAWETREHRESAVSEITHTIDLGARNLAADLTVSAEASRWVALPGMKILVEEEGPANGAWLVNEVARPLWDKTATITCAKPIRKKAEPAPDTQTITFGGQVPSGGKGTKALGPSVARGGAKAIVEAAFHLARQVGGSKIYVASDYRPGSTTTSGRPSDHSSNDSRRAARDIGHRGTNALTGPPTRDLDKACVAIGQAFGRSYRLGATVDADTFHWHGFQIQIIWRTPDWGGHMGHVHVGAHKV